MSRQTRTATAVARSNIALAKYWGKAKVTENIPVVPSLSMTLEELVTVTEVQFDASFPTDELWLDGRRGTPREAGRVVRLLDRVRQMTGTSEHAKVVSRNEFPTAAGLASSASGFAALAAAASAAAGAPLAPTSLSALARRSSASAARSIFGGFVALDGGVDQSSDLSAVEVAPRESWNVRLIVALTSRGQKEVGSTEAMTRSRDTSPLYATWVAEAPRLFEAVVSGVKSRDLERVGSAMEESTLCFHACAMTSRPSVLYWRPGTVAGLHTVRQLRAAGTGAWATMDAGPHVKVLCEACDAETVRARLAETEGVLDVVVASPGRGVRIADR
ncbi:MAG: diphosphomevalonate decarboxylase [Myxococcota bacterium]